MEQRKTTNANLNEDAHRDHGTVEENARIFVISTVKQ